MSTLLLGLLLAIVSNALAQPTLTIGANTRVVGTGAVQRVYGGGALTNNGSLTGGNLNASGPTTYGGSGTGTVVTVSFGHATGTSTLNSLLSVTGRAFLLANTALNANGQLYLRTDQFPNASLVNDGLLTGTVQGLVTRATVTTGATPYNSRLSTNVSGSVMRYQWQSSPDNSQFTNVPGATQPIYIASVTASAYYRCLLTTTNTAYSQTTPTLLLTFTGSPAQPIRYVTQTGTGDGSSWANASGNLQAMIDATGVEQVWVAGGLYKPTTGTDRTVSFRMKNGVAIYGGFVGMETSLANRPAVNPVIGTPSSTTLSGDIGTPGTNSDNSYQVIANNGNNLNNTAVLNGVVITGGNSPIDGSGGGIYNYFSSPTLTSCMLANNSADIGGGIFNFSSSPTLTNCRMHGNTATNGGGIYNYGSNPTFTNCNLQGNTATNQGGGIYNLTSSPTLINCSLLSNTASDDGGGIYNKDASNPTLTNCSLLSNSATNQGGGIYNTNNCNPRLANCVLWNNGNENTFAEGITTSSAVTVTFSLLDNTVAGYTGKNNKTTTTSPFASANDVTLAANSPAIDAGSNQAYGPIGPATDLVGNPRFFPQNGTIDMGAIESQTSPQPTGPATLTITSFTCFSTNGALSSVDFVVGYSNGTLTPALPDLFINGVTITGKLGQTYTFPFDGNQSLLPIQDQATRSTYFVWNFRQACAANVTPPNPPTATKPVAPALSSQTATVNTAFSYTVPSFGGTDPVTYTASGLPNGLTFDPATRLISGTPTTVETPTVTITATNLAGQSSGLFTITVNAQPVQPTGPATLTIAAFTCNYTNSVLASVDFKVGYSDGTFTPAKPDLFINGVTITGQLGQPYNFGFDGNQNTLPIADQATRSVYFVWDFRQACTSRLGKTRLSAEAAAPWQVRVKGNPVTSDWADLQVDNAQGLSLQVRVSDIAGYVVSEQIIPVTAATQSVRAGLSAQQGVYVIQVTDGVRQQSLRVVHH